MNKFNKIISTIQSIIKRLKPEFEMLLIVLALSLIYYYTIIYIITQYKLFDIA